MRTSELAREVEEFGGKKCYNGLRLAQLAALGYNMDGMTGVLAISTSSSRQASSGHVVEDVPGSSRCDSCFMFDDEHESVLRAIINDERARPAKASTLWDERKTHRGIHQLRVEKSLGTMKYIQISFVRFWRKTSPAMPLRDCPAPTRVTPSL